MGTVEPLLRLDGAQEARIRDYVAGRLDAAAAEEFEIAMLEDPELGLAVSTEQAVREGMRQQPAVAVAVAAPVPAAPTLQFDRRAPPAARPWVPALAASLTALAIGFGAGRFSAPAPDLSRALGELDAYALDVMRGAPETEHTVIQLDAAKSGLLLMLPQPDDVGRSFKVSLHDPVRGQSWDSTVTPSAFGGLLYLLPEAAPIPGQYELRLHGADDVVLRWTLELRRRPQP